MKTRTFWKFEHVKNHWPKGEHYFLHFRAFRLTHMLGLTVLSYVSRLFYMMLWYIINFRLIISMQWWYGSMFCGMPTLTKRYYSWLDTYSKKSQKEKQFLLSQGERTLVETVQYYWKDVFISKIILSLSGEWDWIFHIIRTRLVQRFLENLVCIVLIIAQDYSLEKFLVTHESRYIELICVRKIGVKC